MIEIDQSIQNQAISVETQDLEDVMTAVTKIDQNIASIEMMIMMTVSLKLNLTNFSIDDRKHRKRDRKESRRS